MKKQFFSLILLFLTLVLTFSSCAPAPVKTETQTEETNTSTSQTGSEPKTENETEPEKTADSDSVLKVLMIGNSFCTGYPDELCGIAAKEGIKIKVSSVYESGCRLEKHWSWFESDTKQYTLYTWETGKAKITEDNVSLSYCLQKDDWDVISLQQHFDPKPASNFADALASCEPYTGNFFRYFETNFPNAKLVWHHTWAYQVGYEGPAGKTEQTEEASKVLTVEKQTTTHENIRAVALELSQKYGKDRVPCGDAWKIARANSAIGDTLCDSRGGSGDNYHDGDTGGGQYLNACVWFEVLTGKSCIGNSFAPNYRLTSDKITALQEAAHEAVAAVYGEDFAK